MVDGKIPGSNSATPAVSFSEPANPYPAGTGGNTNYGRDINTLDRSMPVSQADSDADAVPGPDFKGTWLGEWGGRK